MPRHQVKLENKRNQNKAVTYQVKYYQSINKPGLLDRVLFLEI